MSNSARIVSVAVVAAFGLAACGDGEEGGASGLTGQIRIDGSSTVAPLSEAAAELFMREHSGVQVSVGTSGTGGGFEKFCKKETDISDASRPIEAGEQQTCQANGVSTEQITVANDAISVLVNKENPVDCLTVDQLRQVWAPESKISNWNQIDGIDHNAPLELYGPGTDSGTFDYFTEAINGEEGAQRTDYSNIGENDNTGLTGVEGSAGGMFYVGYTYYAENRQRVKALKIDAGDGCVAPSAETVQDGTYQPLGRGLFVYPSDVALSRPEVQQFLEFYIANNDRIAEAVGAIPLTEDQKQKARTKIQTLVSG